MDIGPRQPLEIETPEFDYTIVIKGRIGNVPPALLNQYFQQSVTFSMNMAQTVTKVEVNLDPVSNILKPGTKPL